MTPILTCANTKVMASQLVARGPMFVATTANPVKAKAIWLEAREELVFSLQPSVPMVVVRPALKLWLDILPLL